MDINVSVIIPTLNEDEYIEQCIKSMFKQDYAIDLMEWIFVDGGSKDKTIAVISDYRDKYPTLIKLLNNPNKIASSAMNIGIEAAQGEYIIRLDAHSKYSPDYISKCIYWIEKTGADNVGGIANTEAFTKIGKCIAKMLTCSFGVGNSQFRITEESGYVDTVPFGAFRKDLFDRIGPFEESLARNEDNEMNFRIRKNGGKIFLSNEIIFTYYCRESLLDIAKMAYGNGYWTVIAAKKIPGAMGVRHFIPLVFTIGLIGIPIAYFMNKILCYLGLTILSVYFLIDLAISIKLTSRFYQFFILLILFPLFHISYGIGSMIGIIELIITAKKPPKKRGVNNDKI
ncbi:glycosyltransferase family 2 protein [Anaerovoracaceae bacterium SGI.195]